MDGGRFFGFHTKNASAKNRTIENFWLCASCAKSFTLKQMEGQVELLRRDRKTA
jgi:hypothetical protein